MSKKPQPFRRKPRYPWLAKIIRIDTPAGAREACNTLSKYWVTYGIRMEHKTYLRKKRHLLIQSVSETIRRCKAQLARKTLSTKERKEFKQVVKIYASWLKKHRLGRR